MKRAITKVDVILTAVTLAICVAFLCFSIKKVVVDHADWVGGIWCFGILTLFESVLIYMMIKYLKNHKQ